MKGFEAAADSCQSLVVALRVNTEHFQYGMKVGISDFTSNMTNPALQKKSPLLIESLGKKLITFATSQTEAFVLKLWPSGKAVIVVSVLCPALLRIARRKVISTVSGQRQKADGNPQSHLTNIC